MPKPRFLIISWSLGGGSLGTERVADFIERGTRNVFPEDSVMVRKAPLQYYGDFLPTFITLYNCEVYPVVVNSPFCNAVKSWFWLTDGGNTAVLDLKAISEPNRIPNLDSDPTVTTSYGVGELLAAALNVGCTKIIINCEDTGALDGGAGMLLALGARLIDTNGQDILAIGGGRELSRLSSVDLSNIHPKLRGSGKARIEAVCPYMDDLCGFEGVVLAEGPQRKASLEQIENLSSGLERLGDIAGDILGEEVKFKSGSGVSGGLGLGLMLLGAQFRETDDAAAEYLNFEALFTEPWDLRLRNLPKKHGAGVLVVVGNLADDITSDCYDKGITSYSEVPEQYIDKSFMVAEHIQREVERNMRIIRIGMSLSKD
ncbi:glycerate kinase [Annulohypoxylon stygium]|nr:glycerate kinase [Annulohypoxylon stygium]